MNHILHLENPALRWDNASPVGNGSIGAMIWGTAAVEKLTLNEETIWDGGPMDTHVSDFRERIEHIRELFRQQLTEGIRSYEAPDVFDYVDMHFKKIKNGEITAAEAAAELMRYLRMVKFE